MTSSESSKSKWEARYRDAAAPMFGIKPSEYLRQVTARSDFDAASALFLADGDGRNSRWLASRGCAVTAVDLSETATAKALGLDAEAGVSVERIAADLGAWQGLDRRFDAVFVIGLHSSETVRCRAVELGIRHLETGGWFVLDGFSTSQCHRGTMGPTSPDKLYDLARTLSWMAGKCRIIEALEGVVQLAEGDRHDGCADMVRIMARRTG